MTLVSVVLPVYNGSNHLDEAISSILWQTHKDMELIIIDDGSTDDTPRIIQKFHEVDSRVVGLKTQNAGISNALNLGIDFANGKYIARMDADDISTKPRIEMQLHYLEQNGLDFVGTQGRAFGTFNYKISKPVLSAEIRSSLLLAPPLIHPSVLGRTNCFKKLRYDPGIKFGQDYDFWTRAIMSQHRLGNCARSMLLYRTHSGQISTKSKLERLRFTRPAQKRYWKYFFGAQINIDPAFRFLFEGESFDCYALDSLCQCLRASDSVTVNLLLPYVVKALLLQAPDRSIARNQLKEIMVESSVKIGLKESLQVSNLSFMLRFLTGIKRTIGNTVLR